MAKKPEVPKTPAPKNPGGRPRGSTPVSARKQAKRKPSDALGERRKRGNVAKALESGTLDQLDVSQLPKSMIHPDTGQPLLYDIPFADTDPKTGQKSANFASDTEYLKYLDHSDTSQSWQFPERKHSHPWELADTIDMRSDNRHWLRANVPLDGAVTAKMRGIVRTAMTGFKATNPSKAYGALYKGAGIFNVYRRDKYCSQCDPSGKPSFSPPPEQQLGMASLVPAGAVMEPLAPETRVNTPRVRFTSGPAPKPVKAPRPPAKPARKPVSAASKERKSSSTYNDKLAQLKADLESGMTFNEIQDRNRKNRLGGE